MSCLVQDGEEFITVDDVFIKQMVLEKAGCEVAQHAHKYAHTTLVATGALRVWRGDELIGDFEAPSRIYIPANAMHRMMALKDNTLGYCIHNVSRSEGTVEITAENKHPGGH